MASEASFHRYDQMNIHENVNPQNNIDLLSVAETEKKTETENLLCFDFIFY